MRCSVGLRFSKSNLGLNPEVLCPTASAVFALAAIYSTIISSLTLDPKGA